MSIITILAVSFYLSWRLERALHISFIGDIKREKFYKEIPVIKYKWFHSFFLGSTLCFVGWLNFNELGLPFFTLMSLLFLLIGMSSAFDYRMRLIPDTFQFLILTISMIIWAYYFLLVPGFDWQTDLYIKVLFLSVGILAWYLNVKGVFDIGLGDVKFFISLIPIPYELFDLMQVVMIASLFSILYLLVFKKEERGVPVVMMVWASLIFIFSL